MTFQLPNPSVISSILREASDIYFEARRKYNHEDSKNNVFDLMIQTAAPEAGENEPPYYVWEKNGGEMTGFRLLINRHLDGLEKRRK